VLRRLAVLAAVAALAAVAGTARADVFTIVPSQPAVPGLVPNSLGLTLPASLMTPPANPVQLSYPQLLGLWQQAGAAYGIPWQVLAAINKVESNFGRNMGPSSAGAIGWMQFMPSTWMEWGMDANGDGVADPWNPQDAVFSAARYLAAAGGASDLYRAVFAYNHADWYVREVLGLADLYGANSTVAFSLDRMQQSLDAARADVVAASGALVAAREILRADSGLAARLQSRADSAALLSDRLALGKRATLAALARDGAAAAVARTQQQLATAQQALAQAEQASAAASFAPAASNLLASPSYDSGYVFPVGGGADAVSASHTHHDYPAVDIAAPMGSPEYALADSTVLRAWTYPDPSCGIGMTIQAFDGQVWTYCHMAELDPQVVPGAHLTAGEQVGLVGMTGDASGPHLHLQLQPPTQWPQQEAWFQSFAGTAFHWRDAAPEAARTIAFAARQAPVLEVVSPQASSGGVVLFTRTP
jgi:murein DD-endopeptidase MepM/ murein hydrolase activator NlpD